MLQAIDDLQAKSQLEFSVAEVESAVERFHPEVGERLVRAWSLPEWTHAAARYHHAPQEAPGHADEVYTTMLADRMAHHAQGEDELLDLDPILNALGMYEEDLEALKEQSAQILALAEAMS